MALGISQDRAVQALLGKQDQDLMLGTKPAASPVGQGTVLQEPDNSAIINQTMSQAGVQNQDQFMNAGVQMPTGYGTVLKSPSQVMMGAGVPTMEENVAGMMSSTPSTAPTLPEGVQPGSPQANFLSMQASGQQMTPGQIKQAEQFASSMGTTFDPQTGYSRDPFLQAQEQQAKADASRQASLMVRPMEGQTLSQFMRYEDQPIQRTEQFVDPQGRIRRRATQAAAELMGLPEGVQPLAPEYAPFETQSFMRDIRLEQKPDFMQAQPVSSRAGQRYTDAQLRDITGGGDALKQAKALQDVGLDPITGERPEPTFEPNVVELGGRQFLQQRDGQLEELDAPEAGLPLGEIIDVGGVEYVRTGPKTISPLKRDTDGSVLEGTAIEEVEKVFGEEIGQWLAGGKARSEANIKIYEDLMKGIKSGAIKTGTLREQLTPTVAGLDDRMRAIFNPVGQDAVDRVRLVVFQSLRDTLGAQFTQREAERLTAATFNTDLSPEQNLERLRDVSRVLEATAAAKNALAEHYQAGGNFFNYKGPKPLEAFNSAVDEIGATLGQQPTQPTETPGATQPRQPRYKFTRRN